MKTGPAAHLQVWRRNGSVTGRPIVLDSDGVGRERVRFYSRQVRRVTITLANASTRYRCGRGGPTFACEGRPRDQRLHFDVAARVVRR